MKPFLESIKSQHPESSRGVQVLLQELQKQTSILFALLSRPGEPQEFDPWTLLLLYDDVPKLKIAWAQKNSLAKAASPFLHCYQEDFPAYTSQLFLPPWLHLRCLWTTKDADPLLVLPANLRQGQLLWSTVPAQSPWLESWQKEIAARQSQTQVLSVAAIDELDSRMFAGIMSIILHTFAGRYHEAADQFSRLRNDLGQMHDWSERETATEAQLDKLLQDTYPPPLHKKIKSSLQVILRHYLPLRNQLGKKLEIPWRVDSQARARVELMIDNL
jgi:hypothetical protein